MSEKLANKLRFTKYPKRKNNDLVAAMYAMYETGKSLANIAVVYKRSRQSIYDVFKSRHYSLRSKQLKGRQVVDGHQFTLTKDGYLRGPINGERILLHQYIWKKNKGDIPDNFVIFHKDRDKNNNNIDNLLLVPKEQMSRWFNPEGKNQHSIQ